MDFGITIPNYGPVARRDAITAIAGQAEALGFNLMAIADHIVIPKTWNSSIPIRRPGGSTPSMAATAWNRWR